MFKPLTLVLFISLGLAGCSCCQPKPKEENEVKMTIDQVPPQVKATLIKEAEGGKINAVDKETADGKVIYEVDVMIGGKNWEIKVSEDGKLVSKKLDNEEEEKKK